MCHRFTEKGGSGSRVLAVNQDGSLIVGTSFINQELTLGSALAVAGLHGN